MTKTTTSVGKLVETVATFREIERIAGAGKRKR
jgi:hypothetical protein